MQLVARNVNDSFFKLVKIFAAHDDKNSHLDPSIVKESSRNGSVLRITEPVTITYTHPKERVLFNMARDANPFLHLYEALYHLAGRNDVAPLAHYAKQFNEYSDDGKTLNGSYGYRWRHAKHREPERMMSEDFDQLNIIVAHLKAMPNSRRAVLAMWNVEDDLLKVGGYGNRERCSNCFGTGGTAQYDNDEPSSKCPICNGAAWIDEPASRDVCCNLNVMFSLRDSTDTVVESGVISAYRAYSKKNRYLDITVTNRSNDLIWGLLGANYGTFSVLMEYMAARLGVGVGKYHHFSNNLHVYDWNWKPAEWLAADEAQLFGFHVSNPDDWGAQYREWKTVPLVHDPETFEKELPDFVEQFSGKKQVEDLADHWDEPFLHDVAQPMMVAWACHKVRDYHGAFACCEGIEADDWRIAATNWLRKRLQGWEKQKEVAR